MGSGTAKIPVSLFGVLGLGSYRHCALQNETVQCQQAAKIRTKVKFI